MEAFENGETKGQKPPSMLTYFSKMFYKNYIPIAILFTDNARQLEKTVEFKQHYLEPLQNLQQGVQIDILQGVLAGRTSIGEMQNLAKQARSMKIIKEMYLRYVRTYI